MALGKCVNCNIEFNHPKELQTASEFGGHCYECSLKSPVYNPYGYQNYLSPEERRAKFNANVKRTTVRGRD